MPRAQDSSRLALRCIRDHARTREGFSTKQTTWNLLVCAYTALSDEKK